MIKLYPKERRVVTLYSKHHKLCPEGFGQVIEGEDENGRPLSIAISADFWNLLVSDVLTVENSRRAKRRKI